MFTLSNCSFSYYFKTNYMSNITRPWSPITNLFDNATKHSFSKAHRIGNYTTASLKAQITDPAILALYTFLLTLYTAYDAAFIAWLVQQGTKAGSTDSLHLLMDQTVPNLDDWEYEIRGIYKKKSSEFKAIFPKARYSFEQGKQDDRILAINALNATLKAIPALAATSAKVDAFATLVNNAYTTQKGNISTKSINSDLLEKARVELVDGMYYVQGGLMMKYYKSRDTIANYFDVQTLRDLQQSDFTGRNAPGVIVVIAKRSLEDDYNIIFDNTGIDPLQFFISPNNTPTKVGAKMIEVPANTVMTANAGLIRVNSADSYICVYNPSTTLTGTWEMAL